MIKLEFKTRGKIITRYEVFSNAPWSSDKGVGFKLDFCQAISQAGQWLTLQLLHCTLYSVSETVTKSEDEKVSLYYIASWSRDCSVIPTKVGAKWWKTVESNLTT